ncbi:hypothetical protein [Streptomyces sp. HNM0574]|uniref:hypothetical protein n=1 Tax=Streptomyces sp. HNM0574 TaxID=2714954 RepID=UPI00146E7C79|nr:hypothetical protein [Streptomyces sp. HNM0574]NLU70743.1 hypothetical protein [Streptomyces sp. HNM0574]
MAGERDVRGLAAAVERAAREAREPEEAGNGGAAAESSDGDAPGPGPVGWFLFVAVCAVAAPGLMWLAPVVPLPGPVGGAVFLVCALLVPLALVLVPAVRLRRVPHRKTPAPAALSLTVALAATVGVAIIARTGGEERALEQRGVWTGAVVTEVDNRKTDTCTLRTAGGREISPLLSEGDGCDAERVRRGERMRVLHDPEGAAGPVEETEVDLDSGAYAGPVGGLVALTVLTGTWGCVRLGRRETE